MTLLPTREEVERYLVEAGLLKGYPGFNEVPWRGLVKGKEVWVTVPAGDNAFVAIAQLAEKTGVSPREIVMRIFAASVPLACVYECLAIAHRAQEERKKEND